MFRGVLFQGLRSQMRLWPAMIMTSLLFGSVHVLNVFSTGDFAGSALQALAATMSGFVFMAILIRTGSIWPAIIYHALWDFGTFMISAHVTPTTTVAPPATAYVVPVALVLPNFLYALYLLRYVPNEPPTGQR
jgi:membrane protease YdiL (CAAX protease family)